MSLDGVKIRSDWTFTRYPFDQKHHHVDPPSPQCGIYSSKLKIHKLPLRLRSCVCVCVNCCCCCFVFGICFSADLCSPCENTRAPKPNRILNNIFSSEILKRQLAKRDRRNRIPYSFSSSEFYSKRYMAYLSLFVFAGALKWVVYNVVGVVVFVLFGR